MKAQRASAVGAYKSAGFIGKYQRLVTDTVIPYQYSVLNDRAEGAEKSGVVRNFINAGRVLRGELPDSDFYGMVFQDSDAAKWIEAAAYSLINFPDRELECTADELIDIIAEAQDADGYLNTRFTISDRELRWTNLLEAHELYCSGHMMEAACAYYEATGKDKLLKVMLKNAEHIYNRFVTDGEEGIPGHPEIELALMRMYRATGDPRCRELAQRFIDARGADTEVYAREAAKRSWSVWNSDPYDNEYRQAGKPVREQSDAVGHAVRAVYLYTGMADLASETGDERLLAACRRLWESITTKRMYVTGGIGSTVIGEAFSTDYDLPQDTAYCETCASIGLMFFASKMLENEVNSEYADVMERAFYNTVLAGMQLDGKRFFYVNPLESLPGISGVAPTHRHALPQRPGWYACACCPPNAARLISSFGSYAYGENDDTAFCHLYAAGDVTLKNGISFTCETDYPYGFEVTYRVKSGGRFALRIPAWSAEYSIEVNGEEIGAKVIKGYAYLEAAAGDEIKLTLDDTPGFIYASGKVPALTGKTAVFRGPLVYCFEGADNDGDVLSLSLLSESEIVVEDYDSSLLGGTCQLIVLANRTKDNGELYSTTPPEKTLCDAVAVPYYTWANRGENQMRVWMDAD